MNRKIIVSMVIILIAVIFSVGATLAWFTSSASIEPNVFTAGTVILDAEDSWEDDVELIVDNWNPGDCSDKEVNVIYKGTKRAYIRVLIEEEWKNLGFYVDGYDGVTSIYSQQRDIANVKWKNADEEEWDFDDWTIIHDAVEGEYWWYYNVLVEGTYPNDPDNPDYWKIINLLTEVCLDGPSTGNIYQGANYTVNMTFEAVQASHEAVFDEWGVGLVDGSWVKVEYVEYVLGEFRWQTVLATHYWNGEEWVVI